MLPLLAMLTAPAATAQTPIPCCDEPQVEDLVEAVVDLTEAIADGRSADRHLVALREAADSPKGLPDAERTAFSRIRRSARAAQIGSSEPDEVLAFLTRQALWLTLRHEGGDLVLTEGWCATEGGWLQRDLDTPHSPWKGCGGWR